MKKVLLALILITLLGVPVLSLAAVEKPKVEVPPLTAQKTIDRVEGIANWFFAILLALSGIMILVAGFQFVMAGGSPEGIKAAQQRMLYAVIGIAVAFLSKGIVMLMRAMLGVPK